MSPVASGPLDLDKLFAARLHAARVRPYLATALFALHTVESRSVPTMAVDRYWRCYVSPAFVDRTPVEELAGVWVHEVSHLLRDHHGRSDRFAGEHGLTGPGERLRMNIAADCEINDDVYGDGLARPKGAVGPGTLGLTEGRLMEEYLRRFRLGPHTQSMAWLDCGSGADGLEREWDLGPDGADGLSDQERDLVRFRVAQGITARPGNTPKGWRRWAEEAFHPPQPWRELLGAAVRSATSGAGAGEDYSYGRPSRRSPALPGAVLPSLRRRPPRVCVVIDTSGSVSDTELGSALLEVAAISRAWAAVGTWSPWCRAMRRPVSRTHCAVPRGYRWWGAGARTFARASPRRSGRSPHRMSSWSSPTGRRPGRTPGRRAVRSSASSPGGRCPPGTRRIPTTCRTHHPAGPGWWSSARPTVPGDPTRDFDPTRGLTGEVAPVPRQPGDRRPTTVWMPRTPPQAASTGHSGVRAARPMCRGGLRGTGAVHAHERAVTRCRSI